MFLLFPVRVQDSAPRESIPLANGLIVVLNVLAFALGGSQYWCVGPGTGLASVVTYAFAHKSYFHLAGLMWVLLVFGNPVNRRLGNTLYCLAYFGTVVAMGVGARLLVGGYFMGSSGAIFAVIAMFVLLMPAKLIDLYYLAIFPISILCGLLSRPSHWVFWFIRWDRFSIRAVWAITIVPLLEIWGLMWWGWNWTNLAHLLGLVCGVTAVLLMPTTITMNKRTFAWER